MKHALILAALLTSAPAIAADATHNALLALTYGCSGAIGDASYQAARIVTINDYGRTVEIYADIDAQREFYPSKSRYNDPTRCFTAINEIYYKLGKEKAGAIDPIDTRSVGKPINKGNGNAQSNKS